MVRSADPGVAYTPACYNRYGRFLAFIHPDQKNVPAAARLPSYGERLLSEGLVSPYFIWPNINPFRTKDTVLAAIIEPGQAAVEADADPKFKLARAAVRAARDNHVGIFGPDALVLHGFEFRFLTGMSGQPARWVVDLSKNDNQLIHPQRYYTIPHDEDRLFIPAEYVGAWVQRGWQLSGEAP